MAGTLKQQRETPKRETNLPSERPVGLRAPGCNWSFAPHENRSRCQFRSRGFGAGATALGQAFLQLRRDDETEARRRAATVAGRQMGRVRLRGCRSGRQHQNLAFVDRAGRRRRSAPVESDAEPRRASALFAGWQETDLDLESD